MNDVDIAAELIYIGLYTVIFQTLYYLVLRFWHTGRR